MADFPLRTAVAATPYLFLNPGEIVHHPTEQYRSLDAARASLPTAVGIQAPCCSPGLHQQARDHRSSF